MREKSKIFSLCSCVCVVVFAMQKYFGSFLVPEPLLNDAWIKQLLDIYQRTVRRYGKFVAPDLPCHALHKPEDISYRVAVWRGRGNAAKFDVPYSLALLLLAWVACTCIHCSVSKFARHLQVFACGRLLLTQDQCDLCVRTANVISSDT